MQHVVFKQCIWTLLLIPWNVRSNVWKKFLMAWSIERSTCVRYYNSTLTIPSISFITPFQKKKKKTRSKTWWGHPYAQLLYPHGMPSRCGTFPRCRKRIWLRIPPIWSKSSMHDADAIQSGMFIYLLPSRILFFFFFVATSPHLSKQVLQPFFWCLFFLFFRCSTTAHQSSKECFFY